MRGALINVDTLVRTVHIRGVVGDLGRRSIQRRAHELEAPVPGIGPSHRQKRGNICLAPVQGGALSRILTNDDGRVGGSRQNAAESALVSPAAYPDPVALPDRRWLHQ